LLNHMRDPHLSQRKRLQLLAYLEDHITLATDLTFFQTLSWLNTDLSDLGMKTTEQVVREVRTMYTQLLRTCLEHLWNY